MAGFWHLSHHQMRDMNGAIYDGALATFYAADTLNKIPVYADYGLGTPLPNPVQANAYGIFPPVFFDEATGFYRQRISSKDGVLIPGTDVGTLPIIGPGESGGGSEVPVDPNALMQTGDIFWQPRSGTRSGFVRANGRTIGSSVSGASERANADTEFLYLYLWATFTDALCPVTGGRGGSSAADWSGNKPIGLLDLRGRAPVGLDDMGSSAAGRLTGGLFTSGDAITPASVGGAPTHTLTTAQIEAHNHVAVVTDPGHVHIEQTGQVGAGSTVVPVATSGTAVAGTSTPTQSATTGITVATQNTGGSGAHNNMQPFMTGTYYVKL